MPRFALAMLRIGFRAVWNKVARVATIVLMAILPK